MVLVLGVDNQVGIFNHLLIVGLCLGGVAAESNGSPPQIYVGQQGIYRIAVEIAAATPVGEREVLRVIDVLGSLFQILDTSCENYRRSGLGDGHILAALVVAGGDVGHVAESADEVEVAE